MHRAQRHCVVQTRRLWVRDQGKKREKVAAAKLWKVLVALRQRLVVTAAASAACAVGKKLRDRDSSCQGNGKHDKTNNKLRLPSFPLSRSTGEVVLQQKCVAWYPSRRGHQITTP